MTSIFGSGAARPFSIPADVLSLIFVESIPDDIMTDRGYVMFPRPSIHQSPLVLGRVCRRWREISLATPRLWCRIQLGDMKAKRSCSIPRNHDGRDFGRDSVALQEWLRSDLIKKTVEIAISYIRRWKNITIYHTPPIFSWEGLFPLSKIANPVLECLHILTDVQSPDELDWKPSPCNSRLSHITSRIGDSVSMTVTGLHNLRSLLFTSQTMTLEQFEYCITHYPFLEKITIHADDESSLPTMANLNDTYTLSRLTALDIFSASESIGPFLDRISCPLLERLWLVQLVEGPDDGTSWPHVGTFLKRSRPPLQYLHLTMIPMAVEDLLVSFKEIPSLKSLTLDFMNVPDELLRLLVMSPGPDQPLLPGVQNLAILGGLQATSGECLTALVRSRWSCKCMPKYTEGVIIEHVPDCQSLQSLRIDEDHRWNMDVDAVIGQGFNLIIDPDPFSTT